jgi:hypothetical protein
MRMKLVLLAAVVVIAACSRGGGDATNSSAGTTATPSVGSSAAESAVKEYVTSLADGKVEGMLKYDKAYLHDTEAARQSVPSAMWPQKEAEHRTQTVAAIGNFQQSKQYNPTGSDPTDHGCVLVMKRGGTIDFSKFEVRPLPDGRSQAFVQVDYKDQASAPAVVWQGAPRRLKRAMFNLTVEPNGQGTPFVDPRCEPVEGAFAVWDTPPLTKEQAVQLAGAVAPAKFDAAIASTIYPDTPEIRALLEKHGMVFYYGNRIKPAETAKQWVIGPAGPSWSDNPGWKVVLLDHADTVATELAQNGAQASATLVTTFSGCTTFCELWKELANNRPTVFGSRDFYGRPAYDLGGSVTAQTKVNYVFDLNQGWTVAR